MVLSEIYNSFHNAKFSAILRITAKIFSQYLQHLELIILMDLCLLTIAFMAKRMCKSVFNHLFFCR